MKSQSEYIEEFYENLEPEDIIDQLNKAVDDTDVLSTVHKGIKDGFSSDQITVGMLIIDSVRKQFQERATEWAREQHFVKHVRPIM